MYFKSDENLASYLTKNPNLVRLEIEGGDGLTGLPRLPDSVEELVIKGHLTLGFSRLIEAIPELPIGLKKLNLEALSGLTSIPSLNNSLRSLTIERCPSLEELPDLASLEELTISNERYQDLVEFPGISILPKLPDTLITLRLYDLTVKELPALPSGSKQLILGACKNLQNLPELPDHLETLVLLDCGELDELPRVPASLRALWILNTPLKHLPDLPNSIQILWLDERVQPLHASNVRSGNR